MPLCPNCFDPLPFVDGVPLGQCPECFPDLREICGDCGRSYDSELSEHEHCCDDCYSNPYL